MQMFRLLSVLLAATPQPKAPPAPTNAKATPAVSKTPAKPAYCSAMYADDFAALSKAAVDQLNKPDATFTYCLRTQATYECLSYASDGTMKRAKKNATAHGTAFAYRKQNGETLLVTNAHVAEYPAVTDEDHPVSGVPVGCKRVADQLRIVDNEKDAFEGDDIPLTHVVTDPVLDMSVVKTKAPLQVIPWKLGRSSALRERNVVEVRGFPLGAFKATAQGRVTSAFDHDDYKEWDHDDFVVDAQLSSGNSGSPVLAVSCQTGEYELVGVYHADYSRGSSLNVVVHIDQVRELMTTLKRSPAVRGDQEMLGGPARRRLMESAAELGTLFLPFGPVSASVRPRDDGALIYTIFPREFPAHGWPAFVIEDLDRSSEGGFGQLGRVWFGNARGLKESDLETLEADERVTIDRTLDALRKIALLAATHRRAIVRAETSREGAEDLARIEKELRKVSAQPKELSQALSDLADKLAPTATDETVPPSRPFLHDVGPEAAAPEPTPEAPR